MLLTMANNIRLFGHTCVSSPFETPESCDGAAIGTVIDCLLMTWLLLGRWCCIVASMARAKLLDGGFLTALLVKSFIRLIIERMLTSMF